MSALKLLGVMVATAVSSQVFAAEFAFDRPGVGMSTGITPVGQLAWEQALANAHYQKTKDDNGLMQEITQLHADTLLRTGLADNLELQLGWQGPGWSRVKSAGQSVEEDGLGDVSIGLKHAIDLNDEKLSIAVLAEAQIATGNDGFSAEEDIYSLSSAVAYAYNDLLTTSISMRYEWQDSNWALQAVPGIQYQLSDKWAGFSEFIYHKAESQKVEYALGSGLIYALNARTQLDASVGVDLNGADKSYHAGLGVAFLF